MPIAGNMWETNVMTVGNTNGIQGQSLSLNLSSHKSQRPTSMPYRQGLGREIELLHHLASCLALLAASPLAAPPAKSNAEDIH